MGAGGQAPQQHRAEEHALDADPVDQPALQHKADGVEGLNLTIAKDDSIGRGHYVLTMKYGLDDDDSGTFKGQASEDGITFERPDGPQILSAGDGEATGLKWLADKKDCLIVDTGEGYCRD